jgi:RNA polymerase-interacting CarD/CdnL/TRCF family regulator
MDVRNSFVVNVLFLWSIAKAINKDMVKKGSKTLIVNLASSLKRGDTHQGQSQKEREVYKQVESVCQPIHHT